MKEGNDKGKKGVVLLVSCLLLAAGCRAGIRAPEPVADGRAVLSRMYERYQGRWYNTLTFLQKTHFLRRDGTRDSAIWYEAIKGPHFLRIDINAPSEGNSALYRGDSLYSFRNGQLARSSRQGNPFLPLIMGVYLQPVAETERQLAGFGFNVSQVRLGSWDGRPAYVVGGASDTDTTGAQFWIDTERLVLLRMRVSLGPSMVDAHLSGYERVGDGAWLATRILILNDGQEQTEDYYDWRVGVELPDAFFDPAHYRTATHWFRP